MHHALRWTFPSTAFWGFLLSYFCLGLPDFLTPYSLLSWFIPLFLQTTCSKIFQTGYTGGKSVSCFRSENITFIFNIQTGCCPPANAGDIRDAGSIPGLRRSPGGGHGNPLQYSRMENPWTQEPGGLRSTELQSWTGLK